MGRERATSPALGSRCPQLLLAPPQNVPCNGPVRVPGSDSEQRGTERPGNKSCGKGPASEKTEQRQWRPTASQNLQDTFLNHVRKNKTPLTIFLVNGVKLQGVVTWFDNFCVLLRRDGHSQLVYKHAISTIMPGHPIQLFEGAEEPPAGDKV